MRYQVFKQPDSDKMKNAGVFYHYLDGKRLAKKVTNITVSFPLHLHRPLLSIEASEGWEDAWNNQPKSIEPEGEMLVDLDVTVEAEITEFNY